MKHLPLLLCVMTLSACDDGDDEPAGALDSSPDMAAEALDMGGADEDAGDEDAGEADVGGPPLIDYAGESNVGTCETNPLDEARYAVVGFWRNDDCSGEPIAMNAFPINSTAGCYCWPGRSGENSADGFECDAAAGTISIVQYNSLDCGAGDDTPTPKTFHVDECHQDIPPTLYARVIDPGPCR